MTVSVIRLSAALGAAILALGLVSPSSAHHANSAYDRERTISVTGVVTGWQFINPHVGIFLDVTDEQGNVTKWAGEFTSIQYVAAWRPGYDLRKSRPARGPILDVDEHGRDARRHRGRRSQHPMTRRETCASILDPRRRIKPGEFLCS